MSEINALPAPMSLAEWRSAGEYLIFMASVFSIAVLVSQVNPPCY